MKAHPTDFSKNWIPVAIERLKKYISTQQNLLTYSLLDVSLKRIEAYPQIRSIMHFVTIFVNVMNERLTDEHYLFKSNKDLRETIMHHGTASLIKLYQFGAKGIKIQDDYQLIPVELYQKG